MFDCTKDLGGGYEDRLVIAKNVTFDGSPDLDETLVVIRHQSLFGDKEIEYCFMQAGAAMRDERAEIATFENRQDAQDALAALVKRWGPQAISGDAETRVEVRIQTVRFTPVAVEYTVDGHEAFDAIHDFTN